MCLPSAKNVLNPDREKNIKKAKGTKKYVVQKEIGHAHYKEALFIQKIFRHEMNMLRSEEHEIFGMLWGAGRRCASRDSANQNASFVE